MSKLDESTVIQLRLVCPGLKVAIRSEPHPSSAVRRFVESESILQILSKTRNGYYPLADGSGFINKNTKNVQWIPIKLVHVPTSSITTEELTSLSVVSNNGPSIDLSSSVTAFKSLLKGDFSTSTFTAASKLVPKAKLSVFISSTFTDTHAERNCMMEEILPMLQLQARQHGVTVTFADMRFGVKDENTKDHMTWIACAEQIQACYEESDGLFFLSLQSDKYGYRPLPKYLPKDSTDARLQQWPDNDILNLKRLFFEWYILDENSIPLRYMLKPLSDLGDVYFWNTVLPSLRRGLEGLVFDTMRDTYTVNLSVGESVTEWELLLAVALDASRVNWYRRQFSQPISQSQDPKGLFCDFLSENPDNIHVKRSHGRLLTHMKKSITTSNQHVTSIPSLSSYVNQDVSFGDYLSSFKSSVTSMLSRELASVVRRVTDWNEGSNNYLNGIMMPGRELSEMFHHYKIAFDKCATFQGRKELLQEAIEFLKTPKVQDNSIMDVCLSVIGVSGSGKTALMSKLAQEALQLFPNIPVIIRFCGTSPGSVDGLVLITSICRQIQVIYELTPYKAIPTVFEEAVKLFHQLVLQYPVLLFIDSLDQLTDAYLARSKLSFLLSIKCHPQSRIVVSALPDEKEKDSSSWKYMYLCDTRLSEAKIPRVIVPSFDDKLHDAQNIISTTLSLLGRSLSDSQMEYVLSKVAEESTALYLNLAVRVVTPWTCSPHRAKEELESNLKLQGTVRSIINQIIDQLENDFGIQLVRYTIGFITFAKAGVSDIELQDLLSMCDEVLLELFQYTQPSKYRRVPMHTILRLRAAMRGLIVERTFGCWVWYHRQLRETAEKRFNSTEICRIHLVMGQYFSDICDSEIVSNRLISRQPLLLTSASEVWFSNTTVNERRCIEGAYHLVNAGTSMHSQAISELCSFQYICACFRIQQAVPAVEYMIKLAASDCDLSMEEKTRLDHFVKWLRQDLSFLASCRNPMSALPASATAQPKCSIVRQDMENFLTSHTSLDISIVEARTWFRGRTLGGFDVFTPLLTTFVGHTNYVNAICSTPDESQIITGSGDRTVKIWDIASGACVSTLDGHNNEIVLSVCISSDGSTIASGTYEGTIKLWDYTTGSCIKTFKEHKKGVSSLYITKDCKLIVSSSRDTTIKQWSLSTDLCVATLSGHTSDVTCMCLSPDEAIIVSGSIDQSIRIWDILTHQCIRMLEGHSITITSVCVTPDGSKVISGSQDMRIKVWDINTSMCINTFTVHNKGVTSLVISSDGSKIISGSGDNTVKILDITTGECLKTLTGHSNYIASLFTSSDGSRIVSGSGDKTIKIWSTEINAAAEVNRLEGHSDSVGALCIRGTTLVTGSNDKTIKIWDLKTRECIGVLEGHDGPIWSLFMTSDCSRIVSASDDMTAKIWDKNTSVCVFTLEGHFGSVWSACISNDESKVITGSDDMTIKVWSTLDGNCIGTLEGHMLPVMVVCFTIDGSKVISGSYDSTIKIWNAETGENVNTLEGHSGPVCSISIHPDGNKIVSGSDDKTLKIWDLVSGLCLMTFEGHQGTVCGVCVSIDGKKVVSGSYDRTIKIWDLESGFCVSSVEGHNGPVGSLCLDPSNKMIITSSWDKTVKVWDIINCATK